MSNRYIRPEKAINDPSVLKAGMSVYQPSFSEGKIYKYDLVSEPYRYADTFKLGYARRDETEDFYKGSFLENTLWIQIKHNFMGDDWVSSDSLADNSVGADYNDHYWFLTKEDAQDALDNPVPNLEYIPPFYVDYDYYDAYEEELENRYLADQEEGR